MKTTLSLALSLASETFGDAETAWDTWKHF